MNTTTTNTTPKSLATRAAKARSIQGLRSVVTDGLDLITAAESTDKVAVTILTWAVIGEAGNAAVRIANGPKADVTAKSASEALGHRDDETDKNGNPVPLVSRATMGWAQRAAYLAPNLAEDLDDAFDQYGTDDGPISNSNARKVLRWIEHKRGVQGDKVSADKPAAPRTRAEQDAADERAANEERRKADEQAASAAKTLAAQRANTDPIAGIVSGDKLATLTLGQLQRLHEAVGRELAEAERLEAERSKDDDDESTSDVDGETSTDDDGASPVPADMQALVMAAVQAALAAQAAGQ